MTLWVGGLIAALIVTALIIGPLIVAAGLIVWGAALLETGRGHTTATTLIRHGISLFAVTGAFTASLLALVHEPPLIVAVLIHVFSAGTLWCVVLHPKILSADLISYLEETTLLHLLDTTNRANRTGKNPERHISTRSP
ncbi:hypothetical protein [Arthrobacter pityocampae]|uniref:hypothetical protein n=1 Tax=Arthrobacter pityocampae TaxID=547334 RepID=UPI003735F8A3